MTSEMNLSPKSLLIQVPSNNGFVRNTAIDVSGTSTIQLPIVVRMFKGGTQVATETASRNGSQWSAQIKGTYEPGSYRIEVTQSGPVNVIVNLRVPAPQITLPRNGDVTGPTFSVTGTGGESGFGTIKLYGSPANAFLKDATLVANGSWTAQITLPVNIYSFYAVQRIGAYDSVASNTVTVGRVPAPQIDLPAKNGFSISRPVFSGQGYLAGATVDVWQKTPRKLLVSGAVVDASKKWSKGSGEVLPAGPFTVIAIQKYSGGESVQSADHTFTVLSTPVIRTPDPAVPQDTTFTVTGDTGNVGAGMEILVDLTTTVVGAGTVTFGGSWIVMVNVPPGRISLVAEQFVGSDRSGRSAFRIFKIRPPKLAVTVETQLNEQVKFSGAGHSGATVEITKVRDPDEQPLTTTVANGQWQVIATNWVPGDYTLSAIQKVSDNAGGWIPSEPFSFTFTWVLPAPTEVTYTEAYTPTFSGKGYTGATVVITFADGSSAAPNTVVAGGAWSRIASQAWGPTNKRRVYVQQRLNDQSFSAWVEVEVTIPPLAPVIRAITDNELSPTITGTCWPGAVVNLVYSGSAIVHKPTVTNDSWTFRRGTPFAPDVCHTVTVTQTVVTLPSPSASQTFTVLRPLHQPVITEPEPGKEVGRDLIVRGTAGVKGATMRIQDYRFGGYLGAPLLLTADGEWSVVLKGLKFEPYYIKAVQGIGDRESEPSAERRFTVVLLPPEIEVPAPEGDLPRTAWISGTGMPKGQVEGGLKGALEPLFKDVLIGDDGHWQVQVTLPVGSKILWARQTFESKTSRPSPDRAFSIVPAAPFIETPSEQETVGRHSVVSGFGYPGDTVTVTLADAAQTVLAQATVLEDRTWSMAIELDHPGGTYRLIAVQSRDGFDSAPAAGRTILLGSYLPQVDVPAEGQWVISPIDIEGKGGGSGRGEVVAWFNPEVRLAPEFETVGDRWKQTTSEPLHQGGNRVRFRQTLEREGPSIRSDWAESDRFEVVPQKLPPI